ncbi:MAG: hypothetical protein R8G66_31240 [Cytophagales bacterium]|nr:hypothetical protein [Cytophagales bacterium]
MKILKLLLFLLPVVLFGQGPIANEIGQLLQSGEVDKAKERVEFYLKQNSKEVDAIMMKGNVVLNQECCDRPIIVEANTDESIYDTTIGFVGDGGPMVVSEETGTKVANLWKKAVSHDLSRTDIHFGICQIYSISMMTDELIDYLPTLKQHIKNDDRLHYSMCDYARNLKDRGDFEAAIRVYKFVTTLFPEETGLYSDIAAEYFFHGDIELAKENIDVALKDENIDQMSLGNAYFFYALMGENEKALACLKRQSKFTNIDESLFYEALLNYSRGLSWEPQMKQFLAIAKSQSWKEVADFMLSDAYDESFESYLKLNEMTIDDGSKILIHKAFKTKTPDKLAPFFNYAEVLTFNQIFDDAIEAYEQIENSELISDQEDLENVAYNHAWSLWKSGRKEQSLVQWKKLDESENFLYQSASAYFQGKFYYDQDDKVKAKECFGRVQETANQSKYATMAWNYYNSID